MKRQTTSLVLTLLIAGLTSCMVPVSPSAPVPKPVAETKLVFHTNQLARTFADQLAAAGYLALELTLLGDGTQKSFATATKDGSGDFVVSVPGLVAGPWRLRAFFYDSEAAGTLILYARQTEYLAPGQVRSDIVLALYEPGALGGLSPDLDLDAHHIGFDPEGATHIDPTSPRPLAVESRLKLLATVYSSVSTGVPDEYELALNQAVSWTTSDPEVVIVSSSGRVTAVGLGEASVTATSVDNPLARQSYYFRGVPGIEGSWKTQTVGIAPSQELFRFQQGHWGYFNWNTKVGGVPYYPESFGMRGSYTLQEDHITMVTESILLPGSVEWIPWAPGYDVDEYLIFDYSVTPTNLLLYTKETVGEGGKGILVDGNGGGSLVYDPEITAIRVVEDPLVDAEVSFETATPDGSGQIFAYEGEVVDLSTTLGQATVDQLVWVSDTPAVLDFWNDGYWESATAYQGTTTLRGYALDTLDYDGTLASSGVQPLVTLTLTVAMVPDTMGPSVSTSDISFGANILPNTPFTFLVYASDPSGLLAAPSVILDSGTYSINSITDLGGGTYEVSVTEPLSSGPHSIEVQAQDSLFNPTTETFTLEVVYT